MYVLCNDSHIYIITLMETLKILSIGHFKIGSEALLTRVVLLCYRTLKGQPSFPSSLFSGTIPSAPFTLVATVLFFMSLKYTLLPQKA